MKCYITPDNAQIVSLENIQSIRIYKSVTDKHYVSIKIYYTQQGQTSEVTCHSEQDAKIKMGVIHKILREE